MLRRKLNTLHKSHIKEIREDDGFIFCPYVSNVINNATDPEDKKIKDKKEYKIKKDTNK